MAFPDIFGTNCTSHPQPITVMLGPSNPHVTRR
jgi:hypothetical protein